MRGLPLAVVILGLAASSAAAAEGPAALLRAAQARLAEGGDSLAALGAAISAQEAALAVLRAGLRTMPARQAAAAEALGPADGQRLAAVAALDRVLRAPEAARLVHPGGPLAAARAASLLAGAGAALTDEVTRLREAATALAQIEAEHRGATALLTEALSGMAAAKARLQRAMQERPRAAPDPSRQLLATALAEASATLGDLALLLDHLAPSTAEIERQRQDFAARRGRLPLPVADGVAVAATDGGIAVEAPAYATVVSPVLASLRHVGPVGLLGEVLVLEPAPGAMIVIRGLAEVYRSAGEVVQPGEPLGHLGGPPPRGEDFLIDATTLGGTLPRESFYIELWRDGGAELTAEWFALDQLPPGGLQ